MTNQVHETVGVIGRPVEVASDRLELVEIPHEDEPHLWTTVQFAEVSPTPGAEEGYLIYDDPTFGETPRLDPLDGEVGKGDSPDLVGRDMGRPQDGDFSLEQGEDGAEQIRFPSAGRSLDAETLPPGQSVPSLVLSEKLPRGPDGRNVLPNGQICAGHNGCGGVTAVNKGLGTKRLRRRRALSTKDARGGMPPIPEIRQVCESH